MAKEDTSGSFQMIMHFMRSYPWRSTMMLGCLLLAGLSDGIGIATLLPFLNLAVGGNDFGGTPLGRVIAEALAIAGLEPSLVLLLGLIVVGILLKSCFTFFAMQQFGYTVAYVVTNLRLALIRSLLKARWDYFISHPVGVFTNAISTEAIRLSDGYRYACLIIAETIQVLFYLAIVVFISWEVTLVSLLVGSAIILIWFPLIKMSRRAGLGQTNSFQSLIVRLTELLNGIKPIKAMGRENHLGPFLEVESNSLKKALQQQVLSTEVVKTLQEPLIVLSMAIGIFLVLRYWSVPMTDLLVMAFLFHRSVFLMGKLQKQFQLMAVNESAFWSFRNTLQEVKAAREIISGEASPQMNRGVTFRNVSFSYGQKEILQNISFKIPFGKFTVITGLSGAGKTTVADLLTGLIRPDSGEILVDEVPLNAIDLRMWRQTIGYVPQEMFLFHESVLDNITLGDETITDKDVEEALRKADALDFVSVLPEGMNSIVGERGAKISGGQRQRIALARALVGHPKLLVLDEVTTALDPQTEAAVCSTMLKLRGEMAILAISHQPAIMESADLVYHIEHGQIFPIEHQKVIDSGYGYKI